MNEQVDQSVCKHCGGVKQGHQFVCHACWQLLPQHLRRSFVILKVRCFNWLRDFHSERRATFPLEQATMKGTTPNDNTKSTD
jgi:hypothetical protein